MSHAVINCPHCRWPLRVPAIKDLASLGAALQEVPGADRVELRCKWCGESFPLQEALEERR